MRHAVVSALFLWVGCVPPETRNLEAVYAGDLADADTTKLVDLLDPDSMLIITFERKANVAHLSLNGKVQIGKEIIKDDGGTENPIVDLVITESDVSGTVDFVKSKKSLALSGEFQNGDASLALELLFLGSINLELIEDTGAL